MEGQVLAIAGERFEQRLAQEIGSLRIDMAKEFAALRVEMANASASILKWSFLFWIGQFAAVSAMMAFLLRTIGPRYCSAASASAFQSRCGRSGDGVAFSVVCS